MLVDAPRGETTGFTTWYASLWFDERSTLNAFQSLLGVRRFFGVAEDETLEVDVGDHRDLRVLGDLGERLGVVLARAGDAHDVATGRGELGDLLEGRVDVGGQRRGHRLDRDR